MKGSRARRATTRTVVATVVMALFVTLAVTPASTSDSSRSPGAAAIQGGPPAPNVVVILADDLDALVTEYWEAMPRTQALMQANSLTFNAAYATTPTCCPARSALLTGKMAHNNGVWNNVAPYGGVDAFIANGNESQNVATYLDAAGYKTALMGKYLNLYGSQHGVPPGWDEWFAPISTDFYNGFNYQVNDNGNIVSYGSAPQDHIQTVLTGRATNFIDTQEADDDEPFFLYLNSIAPHLKIPVSQAHTPNPFTGEKPPASPNRWEADMSDKSQAVRMGQFFRWLYWYLFVDFDYARYKGSLLTLDDMIADVIENLAANDELANTYIVFASDNGYNWGSHWIDGKRAPYEESARIPFLVMGPDVVPGSNNEFVTLQDLAPTVMDLAGLGVPANMDGMSLAPILRGESYSWRSDFLGEWEAEFHSTIGFLEALMNAVFSIPSWRSLHQGDYVLIEWWSDHQRGGTHEYELYDLAADPYQLTNLIPGGNFGPYAALVNQMIVRMDQLSACSGANCN
ncbi:MAG: Arylsulfatase [Acidimicrobiales bacterium]|nr:MAG: sulfatase [Actinomycetota bacterium]MBV6507717.1 Arylsulfatase [Acidimicrobiales bacterium]RIK07642.1 MAG: sulfatase [Acidobacteriota bacterium]